MTTSLTTYEQQQIRAIEAWQHQEPSTVGSTLGFTVQPLAWLVRQVLPDSTIMGALWAPSWAGEGHEDVLRDAKVGRVGALVGKDLELSDRIADGVRTKAMALAAAEGVGAGFFGVLGTTLDVPALLTLALRTIHKVGVCYGYDYTGEVDGQFVYGILCAAGASSLAEKVAALSDMSRIEAMLASRARGGDQHAEAEGTVFSVRRLAKRVARHILRRKALAAIPIVGAAIGGGVNGWYVRDVGWAARRSFQHRWLRDSGKLAS